jgi:hypothetical protein
MLPAQKGEAKCGEPSWQSWWPLALWPIHASAVDLIVFGLKTTSDLLAVCTTPESDAVHKEAIHYCFGYLEGAVGYHNALSTHKDMKRLTCYPEKTTREDGVRAFIRWAQAHQNDTKLMSEAHVIGLMRSLSATNRIPKGDRECASSPGSRRSRRS